MGSTGAAPEGSALPSSLQVLEFASVRAVEIGAVERYLTEGGAAGVGDDASLLPVRQPRFVRARPRH